MAPLSTSGVKPRPSRSRPASGTADQPRVGAWITEPPAPGTPMPTPSRLSSAIPARAVTAAISDRIWSATSCGGTLGVSTGRTSSATGLSVQSKSPTRISVSPMSTPTTWPKSGRTRSSERGRPPAELCEPVLADQAVGDEVGDDVADRRRGTGRRRGPDRCGWCTRPDTAASGDPSGCATAGHVSFSGLGRSREAILPCPGVRGGVRFLCSELVWTDWFRPLTRTGARSSITS